MYQGMYEIMSNKCIAKNTFEMVLKGDTSSLTKPGQFINIKLEGKYLRRPISVCDYDKDTTTIIYKVVGKGTEQMADMKSGEMLDILSGLGNGFDITKADKDAVLLGGGAGIAPMYNLCRELIWTLGKWKTKELDRFIDEFAPEVLYKLDISPFSSDTIAKGTDTLVFLDISLIHAI